MCLPLNIWEFWESWMDVYVTATGRCLPGDPVDNETMEARLGLVAGQPSRYREKILQNNGIATRHYAIDQDGNQTALNQDLAAAAVLECVENSEVDIEAVEMMALGTTIPDMIMPGFASMVHGRLAELEPSTPRMEILSAAGICASGLAALKSAAAQVAAGQHSCAVAGASELASAMMRGRRFERESELADTRDLPEGFQYFNADFLRWMLSDGAAAFLLENRPREGRLNLRIDWATLTSHANDLPTCMAMGAIDPAAPTVGATWLSVADPGVAHEEGMLLVRQDTKLLARGIVEMITAELLNLIKSGHLDVDGGYDLFMPHISSMFFAEPLVEGLAAVGLDLPRDRWFTNLPTVGNVGSASFYLMVDEALRTGRIAPGDRVLAMIPESGRFSIGFVQFTCVDGSDVDGQDAGQSERD